MSKQELVSSMFDDIPVSLSNLLGVKFGDFSELTEPTTEEDANIVVGKFCVEVQNKLLIPLSGLPVVDALLYIGSLNPPIIAGMFSGLEAVSASGAFDVIAPKDGGIYPGFFDDGWTVRAKDAESLSVSIGEDEFDLTRNDDVWTAKWPVPIGEHSATITDGTESVTVSFSVSSFDCYPAEGDSVPEGDITVTVDMGTIEPESVEVKLTNQDTGEETIFSLLAGEALAYLTAGAHMFFVTVLLPVSLGGAVYTEQHQFTVTESA